MTCYSLLSSNFFVNQKVERTRRTYFGWSEAADEPSFQIGQSHSYANSPNNAVSIRQHTNATYQGLRSLPGRVPSYPLQDSYWARCIGVGTRHRGAAVVTQIKETGSYEAPSIPM